MSEPREQAQPLAVVASLKVKLGLLVAVSALVAAGVATLGRSSGVPPWLSLPVTVLVALAVTQLLAVGMVAPLRQMTAAARRMATGDHDVRVTATGRDEVAELARAFNTMAQDLGTVERQRRELVANVSHELRTPLTALTALLDNLVDGVGPRDPDALEVALRQAERLGGLVDDLLELARVDAGKAPLRARGVAVAALLDDAVAEARTLGRAVRYEVDVEPADLEVRADPDRLRQLAANLLDNASRHSPEGGRVQVRARAAQSRLRLEVRDDGPGVRPEDRDRVFEAFGTLQGTAGGGGTGLGLAIARWVVDLHGGTVAFVDPPAGGAGACVRVELPLTPPDRPEEQPVPVVPPPPPAPMQVPAPPRPPAPVPARPVLDDLFGGFWPDAGVPARLGLLLGALAVGVLAGTLLPFHDLGVATGVVLLAAGAVVLVAARRRDAYVWGCAALCALLALTSVLRDAEWIVVLCLLAGAALCLCGATGARSVPGIVLTGLAWPLAGLRGLPWLGRTVARLTGLGNGAALLRTAAWSLAGLLVFGALLASADAVLAGWVDGLLPDLTVDTFVLRAFVAVAVGGAVLAAAYLATNPPRVDDASRRPRTVVRRFEWAAPVGVVVVVLGAFLAAQATVVFGGHAYLRRTTGLTYAEYVHQGFAQLTVVTALTLLVVGVVARKAPRATSTDRAWLRVALGLLGAETLVVVASALHRMDLYQEAYGYTRLRLLVDVFEGWLGLLVLAVLAAGVRLRGAWLPRFAVVTGAAALLMLAALNPDAWIAERNLERYDETGRVDWYYLQGLSDDAVPVLDRLPEPDRACALAGRTAAEDGWPGWNLARARAAELLPADVGSAGSSSLGELPASCQSKLEGTTVGFTVP